MPDDLLARARAEAEAELHEWLEGKRSWADQHHGLPNAIELTARADEATIRLLMAHLDAHDLLAQLPDREAVRDELSGWPIGSGYYQTSVSTEEAGDMADAVLDLIRNGANHDHEH